MAQPDYVPLSPNDRVRLTERLPPPRRWFTDRPGEIKRPRQPQGRLLGVPGPDQGYAMGLAHRFEERLKLSEGEKAADVIAGCVGIALRRAALFGRAPVMPDLELAFTLWGYLGDAPEDLIELRKPLFQGTAKAYIDQRTIADKVAEASLRLTSAQAREQLRDDWRSLFVS
jgi:hypothetical protein